MFIVPIHFSTYLGRTSKKFTFTLSLFDLPYVFAYTNYELCVLIYIYICVCVCFVYVCQIINQNNNMLLAAVVYHKLFNLCFVMSRDFSLPLITSFSFLGIVT